MPLVIKDIVHNHSGRLETIREKMKAVDLAAIYLSAGPSMFYFTGFSGYGSGWPIWLTSVVIPVKGEAIAFLNEMHRDIAAYAGSWVTDFRTHDDGEDPVPVMKQGMSDLGLSTGRIGVESSLWSAERELILEAVPAVDLIDFQEAIDDLRMVKDDLEQSLIRKACKAIDTGIKTCYETAKVGSPGKGVPMAVVESMAIDGIIPAARNFDPFRYFVHRDMRDGDVISCDLGATHGNYVGDAARTVFVGSVSEELNNIYDILIDTRGQLLEMVKPGTRAEDLHTKACDLVARTGYPQTWRIGHGIGLSPVHEQPLLQSGSRVILQPGMVFTIDPGIHYPDPKRDLPIAIEDVLVVTEDGYDLLTTYTTKVIT